MNGAIATARFKPRKVGDVMKPPPKALCENADVVLANMPHLKSKAAMKRKRGRN